MTMLQLIALSMLAFAVWVFLWRRRERHPVIEAVQRVFRSKSSVTAARWGETTRRKHGMASAWDIWRRGSWWAMRRTMRHTRPSTRNLSFTQRLVQVRTRDVAVSLCRTGMFRVWASIEDVICVFGGPRTGKTGWLAGKILDAPGAVVVTSTRVDLYNMTRRIRSDTVGPVYVFNAAGLGGIASTIAFDPLVGCTDPAIPAQRAADMIPTAAGNAEDWAAQARRVLAALLHAAALGGSTMHDVLRWVADPKADGVEGEITRALRRSVAPAFVEVVRQFIRTNDRTLTSITASIIPALSWLNSPAAVAAAIPGDGTPTLDVEKMLEERATVYLLGRDEDQVAPLVAAFTGHIAREARRIAVLQPSGRLDPSLSFALDEASQVAPVPLDQWTADMGGFGVSLWCAFQSKAQLSRRWGSDAAAVILNNSGAVMMYGGTKDPKDLQDWSNLFGQRDEIVETRDEHGKVKSRTTRPVPVISPAQLAILPPESVAVLRRGMPPVIGHAPMAWRRTDVRRDVRAQRGPSRVTRLVTFLWKAGVTVDQIAWQALVTHATPVWAALVTHTTRAWVALEERRRDEPVTPTVDDVVVTPEKELLDA